MSTLMRDWIAPAARRELEKIIEGKPERIKVARGDDNRQILMIPFREGKSIQVNSFINKSTPYFVWVSDSFTRIRAVFSAASTDAFTRKYGRSFSKGTLGAVLGIAEFYLKVMLKIETFSLQGSEGSGNFGHPVLIEKLAWIEESLSKISGYDVGPESRVHYPKDPLFPVQSQTSISKKRLSPSGESAEDEFYTQPPLKVSSIQLNPPHLQTASLASTLVASNELRNTNTDFLGSYRRRAVDGEKDNSQEGFTSMPTAIKSHSTKSMIYRTTTSRRLGNYAEPSPWEGLARIPRKYVQISKDQRTLLDRDDSWYIVTALAGATKSNVPSSVIKSLQDFHGRCISVEVDATSQGSTTETVSYGGSDKECMKPSQNYPNKGISNERLSLPRAIDGESSNQDEINMNSLQCAVSSGALAARADTLSSNCDIESQAAVDSDSNSPHSETQRHKESVVQCYPTAREDSIKATAASDTPLFAATAIPNPPHKVLEAKLTKDHLPKVIMEESSSPMEMPLSVPHALCDQVESSTGYSMNRNFDIKLPLPSAAERGPPALQVQRTPYSKLGSRSSLREARSPQSQNRILSDPFIPATFDDGGLHSAVPTPSGSSNSQSKQGEYITGAVGFICSTHNSPSPTGNVAVALSGQNNGRIAHQGLQSEHERPLERDFDTSAVNLIKKHHLLNSSNGEAALNNPQALLLHSRGKMQLEKTIEDQVATPQVIQQVNDNMLIQSVRFKRASPRTSHHFHPSPKRRRTVQKTFAQCPLYDTAIDPIEMAEANRRNFSHQLFLKQCSAKVGSMEAIDVELPSTNFDQCDVAPQVSISRDSQGSSSTSSTTQSQQANPLVFSSPNTFKFSQLSCPKFGGSRRETLLGEAANFQLAKETTGRTTPSTVASQQTRIIGSAEVVPFEHQEIEETVHSLALEDVSVTKDSSREAPNIFETFQSGYPMYHGSYRSFIRACVYLKSIESQKHSPPSALWDDLVRVFCDEYTNYHRECANINEKSMAAVDFYKQYVPEPAFTKCILTADTLSEALLLNESLTARYRKLCQQKPFRPSTQLPNNNCAETVGQETSFSPCQSFLQIRQISQAELKETDHLPSKGQNSASKQPFFQTTSQMRASKSNQKNYSFQRGVGTDPHEATLETSGNGRAVARASLDGVGQVRKPIQNFRPFSMSSPVPKAPEAWEPLKPTRDGRISLHANEPNTTHSPLVEDVHRNAWRGTKSDGKLYRLRQASPILGNTFSEPVLPTRAVLRSCSPSTIMPDFRTCQVSRAKSPRALESGNVRSRGSSWPSAGQCNLEKLRTNPTKLGYLPEAALESRQLLTTAAIESFRGFSKAFVPRRKRTSNNYNRMSMPARTFAW